MRIKQLGEFELIQRISQMPVAGTEAAVTGIGDDCAVIPSGNGKCTLYSTDLLVEGVHFLKSDISPEDLGWKSLAVNVSDIAAMGGTPLYALLSIALPADTEVKWIERFMAGFQENGRACSVQLIGGDTTGSKSGVCINVTIIGSMPADRVKKRSGALEGDIVCVTGNLGDSRAGLKIILEKIARDSAVEKCLVERHYRPHPQVKEGQFLSSHPEVHAMMDVSDGLLSDLQRMSDASGCGMEIELNSVPVSTELKRFSVTHNLDAAMEATIGGEDYCLLTAISPDAFEKISGLFAQAGAGKLSAIGRITKEKVIRYTRGGIPYTLRNGSFNHFAE